MTQTTAELREELARREKEEAEAQLEAQLVKIREKFLGKCRQDITRQREWVTWGAICIRKLEIRDGKLKYQADRLNCHFSLKDVVTAGLSRERMGYWADWEYPRFYKPMDTAKFKLLWKVVDLTAHTFMEKYVDGEFPGLVMPAGHEDDQNVPGTPDVPFVQLDSCEADMLPRAYMLCGYRYLLTPGARAAGLLALDGEVRDLYRASDLFEACDMGYVNGRQARIDKLRKILVKEGV